MLFITGGLCCDVSLSCPALLLPFLFPLLLSLARFLVFNISFITLFDFVLLLFDISYFMFVF